VNVTQEHERNRRKQRDHFKRKRIAKWGAAADLKENQE